MSMHSRAIQSLAEQLLARELASVESSHGDADQAVRACEKLRPHLTKLAGVAGFSSLLSRALMLAKRQDPSLEGLRVGADGELEGVIKQDGGPAETARPALAGVVLLTEMLGLLFTLIGQPLTLSLVREAWPEASMETITLSNEETL